MSVRLGKKMSDAVLDVVIAVIASGALGAIVTAIVNKRRIRADVSSVNVQTALALEERAISRFHSATEALDAAQKALDEARTYISDLESYIEELHARMDAAGVKYPCLAEFMASKPKAG